MSANSSIVGMLIALLFVLGCAVSLFFVTMKDVESTVTVTDFKNYSSVASFNNVQNATVIPQDASNFNRWAMVPGEFESTSHVNVNLSSYFTANNTNVTWEGYTSVDFNMTWNMANTTYDKVLYGCATCYRDTVTATPTWTISETDAVGTAFDQTLTTLNYEATTAMYKVSQAPTYANAWQGATMVIDKMNKQSFQTFAYAPYMSVNYFNEVNGGIIREDVIGLNGANMNQKAQYSISEDTQYGMTNSKALTWWINATISCMNDEVNGCAGSYSWTVLQTYFLNKSGNLGNIVITDTQMKNMVGPNTVFLLWVNNFETELKNIKGSSGEQLLLTITAETLAAAQWSTGLILQNYYMYTGCGSLYINDMMDLDMNFRVAPEIYTITSAFDYSTNSGMLLQLLASDASGSGLANPLVMYQGWYAATTNTTFMDLSDEQMTALGTWTSLQVNSQQGIATANTKSLEQSMMLMNETFLLEYATRNVAYLLNYGSGAIPVANCSVMFASITTDDSVVENICGVGFTNLDHVRWMVMGTWYGPNSIYAQTIMNATTLSAQQLVMLYDQTTVDSFGWYLLQVTTAESTQWGCLSATNCTLTDNVVALQWGNSSIITMNPLYTEVKNNFIPSTSSYANWGSWSTPNVPNPPEISYYISVAQEQSQASDNPFTMFNITPSQQNFLFATDYSWYGMNNLYNSMLLMQDFVAYLDKQQPASIYFENTADMLSMTSDQLMNFLMAMRLHTTSYLLEGLTTKYTVRNLIKGWNSSKISNKFNKGDLLRGNLYIDDIITPVINWWMGPAAAHSYTMFTGQESPSEVGSIYAVDGDTSFIWQTNRLYTALQADFINVKWYNEANSGPQRLAVEGYEHIYNYGYRFSQQNTQAMTVFSTPSGIESTSLSVYTPVISNAGAYKEFYDVYGNVTQTLNSYNYSDITSTLFTSRFRDMATYNMPWNIGEFSLFNSTQTSFHQAVYDQQSGYALSQTDYRIHSIDFSGYNGLYWSVFFTPIVSTSKPWMAVVSTFNHTTSVNQDTFVAKMYPGNGTVTYEAGTTTEKTTTQKINVPVVAPVCGVAAIFVVIAICCIRAYFKASHDEQTNESVDVDMGGRSSSFRNINDTNQPLDSNPTSVN